jgi:hypothetical protein
MESIIFNVNEINKVNFSEVIQTPENLVYSVNKLKTYVTWVTPTPPSFIDLMLTYEGPFNDNQLHSILEMNEWLLIV